MPLPPSTSGSASIPDIFSVFSGFNSALPGKQIWLV
jgi:hypothetical protein